MIPTSALRLLLIGGTLAGLGDITYAILFSASQGMPPERLLQFVASGLLGNESFNGGFPTAALGLFLHFMITYVVTIIFYLASRRISFITRRPVVSGILLGIIVFVTMKFIVLPLSAFPFPINLKPLSTITNLLSHMFLFGVPIAIAVSKIPVNAKANGE